MSRNHYPDNLGMHQVINSSPQPYGKCHKCRQSKPIYWVSRTRCLCWTCMKAAGQKPFRPVVAQTSSIPIPSRKNNNRSKFPHSPRGIKFRYKEPTLHPAPKPLVESTRPKVSAPKALKLQPKPIIKPKAESTQQEPLLSQVAMYEKEVESPYRSSPGVTSETLERWERNRLAIERAREHRLSQESKHLKE